MRSLGEVLVDLAARPPAGCIMPDLTRAICGMRVHGALAATSHLREASSAGLRIDLPRRVPP